MTDRWFSPDPPVSSPNKTDRHDITEIVLKVALNTIKFKKKSITDMKYKKNEIIQYCYFCPLYISYTLNNYRILKSQFTISSSLFPDAAGETIYMVCVFSWIGGRGENIHGLFFWDVGETIYMVWFFSGIGGGERQYTWSLFFWERDINDRFIKTVPNINIQQSSFLCLRLNHLLRVVRTSSVF